MNSKEFMWYLISSIWKDLIDSEHRLCAWQVPALWIEKVVDWVETAVIGLNLCPFAESVVKQQSVIYRLSESGDIEGLMAELYEEIGIMQQSLAIETTLLIIPLQLSEFEDYNDSLDLVDGLLKSNGWDGQFQIASFHPHYRFAGTHPGDRENWSNRSPYPIYQILRESSITSAVKNYSEIEQIPTRNIDTLNSISEKAIERIFLNRDDTNQNP